MDVGRIPFSHIAPPLIRHCEAPTDLQHVSFPGKFDLRLVTMHDAAFMIPITPGEAAWPRNNHNPDTNLETDFQPGAQIPGCSTKDIDCVKRYRKGLAQEVNVGSDTLVCKAYTVGLGDENLTAKLITL